MQQSRSLKRRLSAAVSTLGLTAVTTLGSAALQPAAAANQGIFGGGSTLLSVAARQIFDCYHGANLPGDASSIPAACATNGPLATVEGLYAGVGSGSGTRAFISNDAHELLPSTSSASAPYAFALPAPLPVYLDTSAGVPGSDAYPYPELDFGASDSPLPSTLTTTQYFNWTPANNWQTLSAPPATPISAASTQAASYDATKYGQPIQLPAAEVAVALGVNAPNPTAAPWQIKDQKAGVIELSQAQICAIFAGAVTDWSDATTKIAYLPNTNVVATELFAAGNTPAVATTPYTKTSLPITIVYRSDGSGTTFILTNFLSAVCPALDTGSPAAGGNGYAQIFTGAGLTGGKSLPSTKFSDLIANINLAFPARATTTSSWVGQSGSENVAANISNATANPGFSGRIGYVSVDFTQPYSTQTTAPLVASVQDEAQRVLGVYHPSATKQFILPVPGSKKSIDLAWSGLVVPTVPTYTAWNVYAQTHVVAPVATPRSILATPTNTGAYPLTGTTFFYLYSCYANTARAAAITNFLSWYLGGSTATLAVGGPTTATRNAAKYDVDVAATLNANGFNPLPSAQASKLVKLFVNDVTASTHPYSIEGLTPGKAGVQGCKGVTGGAN